LCILSQKLGIFMVIALPSLFLSSLLRVDHAGETGAVAIYRGQRDGLKRRGDPDPQTLRMIDAMEAQEEVHRQFFVQSLRQHRVRPSFLMPLWERLGYAIGYATGRMGPAAAMACTEAVEEVIDEHYAGQEALLKDTIHQDLYAAVCQFRREEQDHRDHAIAAGAETAPAYGLLTTIIRQASRAAITIAKRW
jgi:ubiquinone biosynthesis monooxygenase Coq7